MKILAVDVGTGTQDILLFDSEGEIENSLKLVMPSPTVLAANKIRAATAKRASVVLSGVMMGGGRSCQVRLAIVRHARGGPHVQ